MTANPQLLAEPSLSFADVMMCRKEGTASFAQYQMAP